MARRYSPTNKKTDSLKDVNNEKGAILIMTVFILVILAILFAGMVDFGRVLLIREQNQTATDAAALASSISDVKKMVEISVFTTNRYYRDTCPVTKCTTNSKGKTTCSTTYEPCGKPEPNSSIKVNAERRTGAEQAYQNVEMVVTGTEEDLINKSGWKNYCVSDTWFHKCDNYTLNNRWVKYDENAKKDGLGVARDFYKANMPKSTAQIDKVRVYGDEITLTNPYGKNHPAYPSVIVYATVKIKSLFPNMFEAFPETYKTTTCSQGNTYYVNPNTNKFTKAPEDWCWQSPE